MAVMLLWGALLLLAADVLARWLVIPLLAYRNHRSPTHYALASQPLAELLAERGAEFLHRHHQLLALGYVPVAASGYALSHTQLSFALYRHDDDLGMATLAAARGPGGESVMLEFSRLHADGTVIGVSNHPLPLVFPRWSRRLGFRLPREREPAALRARFLAICAYLGRAGGKLPAPGEELSALADYMNDELQALAAAGFLRGAAGEDLGRLSLRGAYRACWRLRWPLRQLLDARDARRARIASAAA